MSSFEDLFAAATAARARAHAPYSRYPVGAVVVDEDGRLHGGCNIENAAYPEGWCAETSAISHLVMAGGRRITRALVVAERIDRERVAGGRLCTPCGGCRQRLAEFADPDVEITACDPEGRFETFRMRDLLPSGFTLETDR